MATIYVKARPGRRALYEGRAISHDDFVPVNDTPYVRRLINHWEDVEVQGELPKAGAKKSAQPTAPRPDSPVKSPQPAKE